MRILHLITGLSTGGAERALYNLLAGGLAQRYESAVLSLRGDGTMGSLIRELGVPVRTLNMSAGMASACAFGRARRIASELKPDVVQGWMYHGNLAASAVARWLPEPIPVIWNVRHSLYDISKEKLLTRWVIRINSWLSAQPAVIVYNSFVSSELHARFGFHVGHSQVIPNGFDVGRLSPSSEAGRAARSELDLPGDAPVVGHVGRYHPMKDHVGFLRAAVRVARAVPAARFLLVGRNVNLDNSALSGIVPADLEARFIFTGERSDVPDLMQAMDVFCLSSSSEAFPNVLGEAMSCGVPCVTTDVGDSPDIVGETGLVVRPRDTAKLAQAVIQILTLPVEERRALGTAARKRISSRYSLSSVVDQYTAMYEHLIS